VYAPKSDPKHRERWREPYDEHEGRHLRRLASRAAISGVRFGFAISPGLDIDYADESDRRALLAKLAPFLDAGVDWFVLALDDIPARPGLAADQVGLAAWLLDALDAADRPVRLTLVPTEYVGTHPTEYLERLAGGIPDDVDVMWTGPTVCSPVVEPDAARHWADALGGRQPLLWDNYPVNDGPMERALHLGPYRGRPAGLSDEIEGVLCNPMLQPYASRVALATAADWCADPAGYDPDESWARAIADVGGARADALGAVARACEDGPVRPPACLAAHRLVDELERELAVSGAAPVLDAARDHFTAVRQAAKAWHEDPDDPLGRELEPWLRQGRIEAHAAVAALGLIEHLGSQDPDSDAALLHAFAVVFGWSAARDGHRTVFGPRFAVYPAVIQLGDGRAGLDVDLAISEDRNAVDRVCRLALATYRRWAEGRG